MEAMAEMKDNHYDLFSGINLSEPEQLKLI